MIDKRAQDFLDSLDPMARDVLVAPYRNVGELMSLTHATTLADYEDRCQRIEQAAVEQWAADFIAEYYPDRAEPPKQETWRDRPPML